MSFARMWNDLIDHDPTDQILTAYIAKEQLRHLLAAAREGADTHDVRDRLYPFYTWCADADLPELTRLAATIETWWPAILAFIDTGITNARTEGYNRLVKQVKRVACGFRNTKNHAAGYDSTAPAPSGPASSNSTANEVARSTSKSPYPSALH